MTRIDLHQLDRRESFEQCPHAASRRRGQSKNWTPVSSSRTAPVTNWHLSITRKNPADDRRPSYSAKARRGAARQISPSCQSYGKSDLNLSAFFRSSVGGVHAPIITCLAEPNPPRPTRCIRSERRLR